jgi:hypothetical protein
MTQPTTPATDQTSNLGHPQDPESDKTLPKQPKYAQKTIDAINLVSAGLDPTKALQAVNYRNDITPQAVNKFKKKFQKYSLKHPKLLKLAHNAVKDCLTDQPIINRRKDKQGNEIIEENAPTWANKIAAASMVYDRAEPTKQPEAPGGGLTVNIIPIAAQEIIDRMTSWKTRQVEGNVIDVQSGGQIEAGNG